MPEVRGLGGSEFTCLCEGKITAFSCRVIEQTEFVDDETFEALAGAGEDYAKRATRTKLESADKLMYICKVGRRISL